MFSISDWLSEWLWLLQKPECTEGSSSVPSRPIHGTGVFPGFLHQVQAGSCASICPAVASVCYVTHWHLMPSVDNDPQLLVLCVHLTHWLGAAWLPHKVTHLCKTVHTIHLDHGSPLQAQDIIHIPTASLSLPPALYQPPLIYLHIDCLHSGTLWSPLLQQVHHPEAGYLWLYLTDVYWGHYPHLQKTASAMCLCILRLLTWTPLERGLP